MREIVIEKNEAGQRLDKFLAKYMNEASKSFFYKMMRKKNITLNGKKCEGNEKLAEGDVVKLFLAEDTIEKFSSVQVQEVKKVDLDILYEDESLIALDKPAGQLVHPSPRKNDGTLANALLGYFAETNQPCGIHPVTRLDRDTFGVVLLAKNAHIHAKLCQMMQDGHIHKTYLAAVFGQPKKETGEISLPVYKIGNGSLLRIVDPRGKRAVSRYRVMKTDGHTSVLALTPVTGRTHQLRLHCKMAGFPILGDPQYASPASMLESCARGLFTQQLLAAKLELLHPVTGAPRRRSACRPDRR